MEFQNNLTPCSKEALDYFKEHEKEINTEVMKQIKSGKNELSFTGSNEKQKIMAGFQMVHSVLASIMQVGDTALLSDQLNWAKERLPHEGFDPKHVLNNFKIYFNVLKDVLPKIYADEILPYIKWIIEFQETLIQQA